jgi:hypothetical protein
MPIPRAFRQPAGPGEERTGRYHLGSGSIYGFQHQNTFECMKAHDFEPAREHNVYYPFSDREEWELAKFLVDNLNQGQITRFLKLLWVSNLALSCIDSKRTLGEVGNTTTTSVQICATTNDIYRCPAERTEMALYYDSNRRLYYHSPRAPNLA